MKQILYILSFILAFCFNSFAQNYTEYYFKFYVDDKAELDTITQIISIDNVKGFEVFAYANQQELDKFQKLNYKIEFLQKEIPKSVTMATTVAEMASWDRYPTYEVYRQMMKNFELNYPSICKLDSFGTTNNGRKLYVIKISDNVEIEENEPEFFYTSTMHGDETTGFALMLRLADSLLSSYGSESEITNLVDEIEIFINPNANPDGTYYGGNNTVSSARRYNGNAVDLNRDFPDPRTGANSLYQVETQAMMDFAEVHNFVMSANFHGGAEVMNYPWDTWSYSENPHSDTEWFEQVCTDYVTTARTVLPSYMSNLYSDGVTHGATWYKIDGGRQDYMNFWHQCREVTIEISSSKLLATESLNNYWNYNKESLLQYMEECLFGIRGIVTNYNGLGEPLDAMIWIENHDNNDDSSMVFTDSDIGDYHRLIEPGTYDIIASSDGYFSDTAKNIVVTAENIIWLNFKLSSIVDSISLHTDPANINDTIFYDQINSHNIVISNDSSAVNTSYNIAIENEVENYWIKLNKSSGTLLGSENDTTILSINADLLSAGYYSSNILLTAADSKIDTIPVNIIVKDSISTQIEPEIIIDTLWGGDTKEYEIIVENNGLLSFNYYVQINDETLNNWISLNKSSGNLLIAESDTIIANIATTNYGFEELSCDIIIQKENSSKDTIPVQIYVKDTIASEIYPLSIIDTLDSEISKQYPVVIKNIGNKNLEYSTLLDFPTKSDLWINQNKLNGIIFPEHLDTVLLTVNTSDLITGSYVCLFSVFENDDDDTSIPIEIFVKNIQSIQNKPNISDFKLYPNPFTNQINIEFIPIVDTNIRLNIYNIFGNYIFGKELNTLNNDLNKVVINDYFNVNQLPNGIYFIQISSSDFQITKKVIKH
ncbi:MAG: T9SS type A sorting domain-containing protein [Bacteroidales bacterium]|nr:T9SS type A sorting domain-containing protein [Bacteroidales bacterium]